MNNPLCGTGQGNSMSGAICRDISYLIFKYLENMRRGLVVRKPMSNEYIFRMIVAFIDDTDFYSSGEKSEEEMKRIMTQYTKFYEATGCKIQEDKTQVFTWKWELENGEQIIRNEQNSLIVCGKKVNQLKVED